MDEKKELKELKEDMVNLFFKTLAKRSFITMLFLKEQFIF